MGIVLPLAAADELASRPHLARVLAERQRRERDEAEAARRAEHDRLVRRSSDLAGAKQARSEGRLEDARELLATLARDYPNDQEIQSTLDAVRWQVLHLRTQPAEKALSAILRRPLRDDPRAAVDSLANVDMHGLPEDLGRRIFGA